MGGMGGSGSSNSVIKAELLPLWATDRSLVPTESLSPLDRYMDEMQLISQNPYTPYSSHTSPYSHFVFSGKTIAEQGEPIAWADAQGAHSIGHFYEVDGLKAMAARGRNGHALLTSGETLLRDIIKGLKFNSNTKIDDAYLARAEALIVDFEENTLPAINRKYNFTENFGSDAHHVAMAKAAEMIMAKLAEISLDIYFKDYLNEKTLQGSALRLAIPYGDQDEINANAQIKAGELQREYAQALIIDSYNKWSEDRQGVLRKLEVAGNAIKTVMGAQSREVTPFYRPSDMSQIAGLALAGMGIYGMIKGEKLIGSGSTSNANAQYSPSPMAIPAVRNENTGWGG